LQFLTRLPVRCEWSPPAAGRSLLFYPLVGLLIGALLAMLVVLLPGPDLLAAALVLAAWVLITGALHLDGLADSADAWLGGHGDRERTLAIMKDPYTGPMGATALILLLGIKWAALVEHMAQDGWVGLLLAPVLARTAVVVLLLTTPYVRSQGLGTALSEHLPRRAAGCVVTLTAFPVAALSPKSLLAALTVFAVLRLLMMKRLGGATGDTAGATIEITEAAVLVALAF
jgi:adenosylcobinamide-GDP ribazoletransferase